jgi:hypothetical protein
MPLLFFGTIGRHKKPKLFSRHLELIEVNSWDRLTRLGRLTPRKRLHHVARLWHLPREGLTALSWIDDNDREQTVFMPGLLNPTRALTLAREIWPSLIPSPITFRIKEQIWQIK